MPDGVLDPDRAPVHSLSPRFVEAMLAGTKTVAAQRIMTRITASTLALLYASGSAPALVVTCVALLVVRPEPLPAPVPLHVHGDWAHLGGIDSEHPGDRHHFVGCLAWEKTIRTD